METPESFPNSPDPMPKQIPDKPAQRTESNEVAVGGMGYFDTVSKVLAGIAFAAWMIEEWTGIKILLFAAILTGTADVFYLVLHKVVKHPVRIIIGWGVFAILSWFIFRSSLTQLSAQSLYWLRFVAVALFAVSGWVLFSWALMTLRRVEKRRASNVAFSVSERFVFVPETGYYRDSQNNLRICGKCLLPPTCTASPLCETVGIGSDFEPEFVARWCCQNCGSVYPHAETDEPPN